MASDISRRVFVRMVGAAVATGLTSFVAGCGLQGETLDVLKLALVLSNESDSLSKRAVSECRSACSHLGIQLDVRFHGNLPGQTLREVQQLIEEGCRGIALSEYDSAELPEIIGACNAAGVFLTRFYRHELVEGTPAYQAAVDSPFYVGSVLQDDFGAAKALTQLLLEGGSRVPSVEYVDDVDPIQQLRIEGCRAAVDEWNASHPAAKVSAPVPVAAGALLENVPLAVQTTIEQNPTIDSMLACGGADQTSAVLGQLANMGLSEKVSLASIGLLDDLVERFTIGGLKALQSETMRAPLLAVMLAYQACMETHEVRAGELGESLLVPYTLITSLEEAKRYQERFIDGELYSAEELEAMLQMDFDALQKKAQELEP